jgi:hypothetical protein
LGTGENAGMLTIHGQSPYGLFSLKTIVLSSGVSIEASSPPLYGPVYLSPPASSDLW